jgi:hypothetical protein
LQNIVGINKGYTSITERFSCSHEKSREIYIMKGSPERIVSKYSRRKSKLKDIQSNNPKLILKGDTLNFERGIFIDRYMSTGNFGSILCDAMVAQIKLCVSGMIF